MNPISFMSSNFVARELGYRLEGGWPRATSAANEFFQPIETFPERFSELLADVRAMGFQWLDIWCAHLNWVWATEEHLAIARELLDRHGLRVASLAGSFGAAPEELEAACRVAAAVGTEILSGDCRLVADRAAVASILERFGLKLAVENHDEGGPDDMLNLLEDGGGRIGTTVDTGWYGTYGYDPVRAVEDLGELVFHVHLKDIEAPGGHVTCSLGCGSLPVEDVVAALWRTGYAGAISIEHEPEDRDPTEECIASLAVLRGWLGKVSRPSP